MTDASQFSPPIFFRSGMIQTALASSKRRQAHFQWFEAGAQRLQLEAGQSRATTGYVHLRPDALGLVVLFHGWLGTPQSAYVISAAKALFDAGFSVARLTLPEHGEASLLTEEVVDLTQHAFMRIAVQHLADEIPELPIGLMGFSLGGNFALRLARDLSHAPIPRLRHVVVISPVIDPSNTCDQIDASHFVRRYFMKKFKRLSREKLFAFPHIQGVENVNAQRTIRALTEVSVARWTDFATVDDYFAAYRIGVNDFSGCKAGVTILTALDDPIVKAQFAQPLLGRDNLDVILTRFGGHNGFFTRFPSHVFSEDLAVDRFRRALNGA